MPAEEQDDSQEVARSADCVDRGSSLDPWSLIAIMIGNACFSTSGTVFAVVIHPNSFGQDYQHSNVLV